MKEVRAIVLGLVVVLVIAMVFAFWNRQPAEFTRIKEFHVEVKQKDGDSTRRMTFKVPTSLLSHLARLSHIDSVGGNITKDWANGDVTVQDILEAYKGQLIVTRSALLGGASFTLRFGPT